METNKPSSKIWRWIALSSVVISIIFSYLSNTGIINEQTNAEVSAQYPTLFTPAGYAFSIWGLIYLTLIVYAIYQLLPGQRNKVVYDQLAKPLTLTSLISMAWLVTFNMEWLLLSAVLIVAMLITAVVLQVRAREAASRTSGWLWITIPFSLYAGWLTVATIANVAIYLTSVGWTGRPLNEATWAAIMIVAAVAIGIVVSWRRRDIVYPLVIVWACVAIWIARQVGHENVAIVALAAAILLLAWTVFFGFRLVRHPDFRPAVG